MAHNGFKELVGNRGFRAFLVTQFLGAFNDQIYQTIVGLYALRTHGGAYVALIPAVFNLPFFLFSGYSGHLSDRVSKRTVLRSVKLFEIAITVVGLAALGAGSFELMLLVVFLLGLHSTVFSPAKYGIVPEIVSSEELSRGNALLETTTFVGIVLGIVTGTFLYLWAGAPWRMGAATIAVAAAGFLASAGITRVKSAGSTDRFRLNPFAEIGSSTRHALRDRPLWLAVLGTAYFWFTAVVMRANLGYFGKEALKLDESGIGLLWCCLALGVGGGNMLAGRWSGEKVELGLVPFGSMLMGLFGVGLFVTRGSATLSAACATLLAVASGLFVVPLFAFIQQRSGSQEKGRAVATSNFYQTLGMLAASAGVYLLHETLHVGAAGIMALFGVATLLLTAYLVRLLPEYFVRFILWLATHTIFRIRVVGRENVPARGPALLVANHMSHADGLLIAACLDTFIRYLVWKPYYEAKALRTFFRLAKAIPVGGGPREILASIRVSREALKAGDLVCIFAEGSVTRTSSLLPFKRGMEKIVAGLDVPVIPVHLDGMWGSVFSFERGKFFWKWPKHISYPVTISFGAPMPSSSAAYEVRQAIQELDADAWQRRKSPADLLDRRFIKNARRLWSKFCMADTTGRELTYGRTLTGAVLVSRWLQKRTSPTECVGVMLPASVGGALVNAGITLSGCVAVNLNFTAGPEAMASAIGQCGIRTIVTSKLFLAKAKLAPMEGMVFLEDILASAGRWAKLSALVAARIARPARLSRGRRSPDSAAAIIFSSGSAGAPKGVALSHFNLISNIESVRQLFWLTESDRITGSLPFFHSFGYTVSIWMPLVAGCGVAYHSNPADARAIGELVAKYKTTFLIGAPTFYASYIRKCSKEEFASLRLAVAGAEKLRTPLAEAFREKFGMDLLEGYGCTEMSPIVAANAPGFKAGLERQIGAKPGTVGQPLPGVAARIVDTVTFEPLPPNQEGLLLVKGPNRMLGYLGDPRRTSEALREGWYITGDVAVIDEEGFIRITDRLARFSKIGGEMVPFSRIEEVIAGIVGEGNCVVTAVDDERRGERLVALYCTEMAPTELWQRLSESELPRLWIPKRENLYPVAAIPQLGTGKIDLRAVKDRALELSNSYSESRT